MPRLVVYAGSVDAQQFALLEKLLDNKYVDYEKYTLQINPSIPHSFLKNIVDYIKVTDGRAVSIAFKNGMVHRFLYRA